MPLVFAQDIQSVAVAAFCDRSRKGLASDEVRPPLSVFSPLRNNVSRRHPAIGILCGAPSYLFFCFLVFVFVQALPTAPSVMPLASHPPSIPSHPVTAVETLVSDTLDKSLATVLASEPLVLSDARDVIRQFFIPVKLRP